MKARVTTDFHDVVKDVDRRVGEVFICSKARFAEINDAGYGRLVEEVREEGGEDA